MGCLECAKRQSEIERLLENIEDANEAYVELRDVKKERDALRDKLRDLVDKLDEVEPAITNAFLLEHIHGRPYNGPTYAAELKAARTLLEDSDD